LNVIVRERLRRTERTGRGRDRGKPDEEEMATTVIIEASKSPYKLIPMPKQRWIIARADSETMEEIAKWIEKLDKPEQSKSEQTIVQVRYVDVREVVDIVRKTLQEIPGTEFKTGVIVEALPQSRQIVIFGSEENRKMVEALIAEIDLPSTDIFEQRTFKLKHADPDKLKENIEELYEDSNAKIPWYRRRWRENTEDTVRVISYPATSQITVIASAKNMEKIAQQIKEEWDKPVDISRDQYRIISLKNSDPVKMAELLTKLFSEELSSGRSPWSYIFNRRDEEEAKKKIVGSLYGTLTFEAVPDTKKLIVISNLPEAYDIVEQLVKELDSQDTAEVPKVITLQYADPEDLSDQLNAILNEPGTLSTIRRSKRGLSIPSSDSDGTSSKKIDEDDDGDSANIITPWWDKSRRRDDEMPASNLIGKVRFIPVARSKAILVLAPPEYMVELEAMINTLDQPGKQVMIKAVIVEMNHDDLTSLGVKLSSNPSSFGTLGENAMQVVNTFTNLEQFGSITLESSLSVNVLVDLLVQKANAKILNQPTLWTKDNEEAVFFKGRQVPFVESDQTDTTGASIKTSVDYRDVGVTLRIRPNITPEKAVDININLEISQVEDQLVNGQIATNKLDTTTHLIVDNGQTLMLGGILFQTESRINTKVPLLGDIPVVGGVFNHNKDTLTNNELLIFLTPYVIDEQTNPSEMEQVKGPVGRMREVIERLDSLFENKIYLPGYVSPEDSDSDQGVELPAERID
jgi:general secretion pathway protein D